MAILNFTGLTLNDAATGFKGGTQTLTFDGKDVEVTTVADATTATFKGYGTVTLTAPNKATFTADSSFAGGDLTLTLGTTATKVETIGSANFGAVSAPVIVTTSATLLEVIGGSGNDSLTGGAVAAKLTGGAGNDTITSSGAADTINAGAGDDVVTLSTAFARQVTLGAGADTLSMDTLSTGAVTDYNYAQGDKLVMAETSFNVGAGLTSGGVFTNLPAGVSVTTAAENGVYKVAASAGTTNREYWTAGAGATAVMDASSYTNAVVMDAATADSASISLGYGADTVTLSNNADTVKVGKASGTDTFKSTFGSDDTLVLTGNGELKDLQISLTGSKSEATYGNTLLKDAFSTTTGIVKVSTDNGATAKTVAYDADGAGTLTTATDVDVYMGNSAGTSNIKSATSVDLYNTDTYMNGFAKISVTGEGTFVGAKGKTTAIDASTATGAVSVYGGSTLANTISLDSGKKYADTVWFGTTDGADTVTNFKGGFETDSDTLYLYDTADVKKLTFSAAAVQTGASKIELTGIANDKVNIMLPGGTVKKVAANLQADNLVNAEGADIVIGKAGAGTTVKYGETQTESVVVDLYDTDKYTDIVNVDTTDAKKGAVVVGAEGLQSTIKTGAGENFIWAGSTGANTISLSAGAGTDTVWFKATDGQDTIKNFQTAKDTVRLIDVTGAADIANTYGFAKLTTDGEATLASSANKTNGLTIKGGDIVKTAGATNTINLADAKGDSFKAAVGDTNVAFATDTSLYYSTTAGSSVVVANTVTGTILACLNNGAKGWSEVGSYYFNDNIKKFDASKSAATTALIGGADQQSSLVGGLTDNTMWGGGYGAQDMQGNISAVDTIWFGTTDGQDTFSSGVDKGDTIWMYDVTSIDSVKMDLGTNEETLVIGGSTLNIQHDDGALDGGLTFKTASGAAYTYDTTKKKFVTKA